MRQLGIRERDGKEYIFWATLFTLIGVADILIGAYVVGVAMFVAAIVNILGYEWTNSPQRYPDVFTDNIELITWVGMSVPIIVILIVLL